MRSGIENKEVKEPVTTEKGHTYRRSSNRTYRRSRKQNRSFP